MAGNYPKRTVESWNICLATAPPIELSDDSDSSSAEKKQYF